MNSKSVLLTLLVCLTGVAAMAQNDGIVLNKTVANQIWDKTTESKLTLEAYATGEVVITETMEQTPCDIVLVLDVSGSMGHPTPACEYKAFTQGYSMNTVLEYYHSNAPYCYLDEDGLYYEVEPSLSTSSSPLQNGGFRVSKSYLSFTRNDTTYYLTESGPVTTNPVANAYDTFYVASHDEALDAADSKVLWTGTLYRQDDFKVDALKNAVCNFIDVVADSAVKNSVDHKISLVKFGSPLYYISESSLEEGDVLLNDTLGATYTYFVKDTGITIPAYRYSGKTGFWYNASTPVESYKNVDSTYQGGSYKYFVKDTMALVTVSKYYGKEGFWYSNSTPVEPYKDVDSTVFRWLYSSVNGAQVIKNLKDVSNTGSVNSLKDAINNINVVGATAVDYGMNKVKYIFGPDNPDYVPGDTIQKRNKVVIMFTDGVPTYKNSFSDSVANKAIALAKELKDSGAVIYTVGLLDSCNEDIYNYMSYVSSKYPSATALDAPGSDSASGDYFFYVTSSEGLVSVFENIAKQTPSGGAILNGLNENTVVKDVLTKYFKLPEGTNTSDIKVYTANYDAANATFSDPQENNSVSISFADSNKTINVNGFNFSEHWCGPNAPDGQKLIIEIPIVFNNVPEGKSFDWTHVPTNEDESAIYAPDGTLIKRFPVPYADLSAVVLPIELIAFQAKCMDNAIQFTWSTATETNNEYFTIDRSEDAVHYTEVARVQGAGTSAFRQDYSFMTDNTTNKTMYYRLRQTDIDGTTEAFSPIAVQCGTTGKTDVVIYPMPATDQLHIASSEEISYMQFYNVYGDDAKQVQVNAYNANVDITDLSSGIYMLKITMCDGKIITKKIVKSTYQH